MNAISTLTILPRTKAEIDDYVAAVKLDIMSGYINPLETGIMLKAFETIIKTLRSDDDIAACIQGEADKYVEKTIDYAGVKFAKSERRSYTFAGCGCSRWEEIKQREIQAKAEREGVEKWLKTLTAITPDMSTGEAVNPPAYETATILSITLKK